MEIIRKKYKYRCEKCKTDILNLDFDDFKEELDYNLISAPNVFKSVFYYYHICPVCGKHIRLEKCEIYRQYKIINKEEIIEVSDEN